MKRKDVELTKLGIVNLSFSKTPTGTHQVKLYNWITLPKQEKSLCMTMSLTSHVDKNTPTVL